MSNFTFDSAQGKVAYYATLPATNDGLIAVPLRTTGLEADGLMAARTTLAAVLTASQEQTTLGRKPLTNVTVTPNSVSHTQKVDADDFTYTAGSGSPIACFIICYVPVVGSSADNEIIPLTKHDFSVIPSGVDIPVQISTNGLFVASSAS